MWRPSSRIHAYSVACSGVSRAFLLVALWGCRQDMHDQPRYKPLGVSHFFADGKAARELVPGTVPHGYGDRSGAFYTGKIAEPSSPPALEVDAGIPPPETPDKEQLAAWRSIHAAEAAGGAHDREENLYIDTFPMRLTERLLNHGQERYEIYCAVCHDRTGSGNGMIVRKGFTPPPSFHSDRLRNAKLGHFFDVITQGFGAMPSYEKQIPSEDRWAIIAYIRALQLSQWARLEDVPPSSRNMLLSPAGPDGKGTSERGMP